MTLPLADMMFDWINVPFIDRLHNGAMSVSVTVQLKMIVLVAMMAPLAGYDMLMLGALASSEKNMNPVVIILNPAVSLQLKLMLCSPEDAPDLV